MKLLVWLAVHALALGAAIWLFEDITLSADNRTEFAIQLALAGALFGLVSSFVKPAVQLISLPFIILTLGLLLVVINALMLLLTSRLAEVFDLGFHVDGFWTAVWGGLLISVAGMILESILPASD